MGRGYPIGEESLLADPDSCPADGDHFNPKLAIDENKWSSGDLYQRCCRLWPSGVIASHEVTESRVRHGRNGPICQ